MARQPKKIEVPGDVVATEEIASPITETQPVAKPAKAKVQKASSEDALPDAANDADYITPADAVAADIAYQYSERRGDWVLTRTGWQFLPDK